MLTQVQILVQLVSSFDLKILWLSDQMITFFSLISGLFMSIIYCLLQVGSKKHIESPRGAPTAADFRVWCSKKKFSHRAFSQLSPLDKGVLLSRKLVQTPEVYIDFVGSSSVIEFPCSGFVLCWWILLLIIGVVIWLLWLETLLSEFNSLWRSDAIRWLRSGLAQIMAWCLTAPSHYLNQYLLHHQRCSVAFTWEKFHMIHSWS